jgi:hypothetical protein
MALKTATRRTPKILSIDPRAARYALPQCYGVVSESGEVLALSTTRTRLATATKKHPTATAFAFYAMPLGD